MLAKFSLVVLVLVFGAVMFAAGTVAPESMAQPVRAVGEAVVGWFNKEEAALESATGDTAPADKPILYSSLVPPAGVTDAQKYGLQIGLYNHQAEADAQALALTANKYDFKQVQVEDNLGTTRYLLVAGPFETLAIAQFQQEQIPQVLGVQRSLQILLFPE